MAQTITLKQTEYQNLINRISRLEKIVADFIRSKSEPPAGSNAWWLKTIQDGENAIQKKETVPVRSDEDIDKIFSLS